MDDIAIVRCAACRHPTAYDDDVRTVDGRRFHSACIDAHHVDGQTSRTSVSVVARFIRRYAGVLSR